MPFNDASHRSTHRECIVLALILILGAALRILNLNVGFFGDELHTVRVALCYPFAYIISNNWGSFFYQVLVHFLLPLGTLELVARIPAVIFGVLGIYAVYLLTRHLFGRKEALFAAAYLAVLPFHIYWSQTARGYSAFLLFSLLALYFFLKSITDNRFAAWSGYVVFSILAAYTHLFYISCLVSHAVFEGILFLFGLRNSRKFWTVDKKHITAFVLSLVMIGVIVFVLYYPDLTRGSGIERITLHSKFSKQVRPIDTNIGLFFQLVHRTFIWNTQSWKPHLFLSILLLLFLVIGIIASMKNEMSQLILIVFSIAVPVALFLYGGPSDSTLRNAPDRYLTYLLPFFLILISRGVIIFGSSLPKIRSKFFQEAKVTPAERRLNSTGIITIFIILCALFFSQIKRIYHYRKSQPDFKEALQYVNAHMEADAVLVLEGTFLFFFEDSNIRDGLPVYIDGYYKNKNPLLSKYDTVEKLKEFHSQKKEVWSIVYTPEIARLKGPTSSASQSFQKLTVIKYERDTLLSNFIKLFTELLDLKQNNKEDYLLILTLLHLKENEIEKAGDSLLSLGQFDAYDLPNREDLKPGWASHILSKRQQMYNRLSHAFFSKQEFQASIFSFLRFSKRLISANRIGEAVDSLEKYLSQKIQLKDRCRLVNQFLEPLTYDEGCIFLWRDPDGWHVRWKTEKDTKLKVHVSSSSKIRAVQKTMLEDKAAFQRKPQSLIYETRTQKEGMTGFDFQVKGNPKLTFDLSLNLKNIQKVFFSKKEKMPQEKIPEDITAYTGKSGRTTLFID